MAMDKLYGVAIYNSTPRRGYWEEVTGADKVSISAVDTLDNSQIVTLSKGEDSISIRVFVGLSPYWTSKDLEDKLRRLSPWVCTECSEKNVKIKELEDESVRTQGLDVLVRIGTAIAKELGSERDVSGTGSDKRPS